IVTMTTTPESNLVKLVFVLKDQQAQPITAKTRIVVEEVSATSNPHCFCAEGEEGEVTDFTIELRPGTYSVEVKAEGFRDYSQLISVSDEREARFVFILSFGDSNENVEEKEGTRLQGRSAWFVEQRTFPGQVFPVYGRAKALEQKKHMNDPEV